LAKGGGERMSEEAKASYRVDRTQQIFADALINLNRTGGVTRLAFLSLSISDSVTSRVPEIPVEIIMDTSQFIDMYLFINDFVEKNLRKDPELNEIIDRLSADRAAAEA
jgi:ABC-type transporter Mla subunit MlaD